MGAEKNLATSENSSSAALVEMAEKSTQKDAVSAMTMKMKASLGSIGAVDNLRHTILSYVTDEKYDLAVEELKRYLDSKPQYPQFKERTERYVSYGAELIQAIRAKRSFPGWNALNMSKQKDLFERAIEHFEDLKVTLTKIEVIEKEVRVEDMRSTVWVIQALVICVGVFMVFIFMRELAHGFLPGASILFESSLDKFVDFVFDKLGM